MTNRLQNKRKLSPKEIREYLEYTKNGTVKNTLPNCMLALENDEKLQDLIQYNSFTGRIDVTGKVWWNKTGTVLNDTDLNYLLLYLEQQYDLSNEKKVQRALNIIADQNQYHPIRDYLNLLQWDGQHRIRYVLHHFLGAEVNDYTHDAMLVFLLGAINRVFEPGYKFETMLCLVGGQGAGKSTFFRFLAMKDEWFSDDLKKLDDENIYRKMQGHLIIEMSEMIATANAKSIEEIKSFLSRHKDTYKVPYEVHPVDRPRQCVFGGTSNTMDFLPLDRTGNRRFHPIIVDPGNAEVHILEDEDASRAYMEQVWAEAMELYRKGNYRPILSRENEQYLKEFQKNFMPEDAMAGMIQAYLDGYKGDKVCSKQLYHEALNHPYEEPKSWELREINNIMNTVITGWKAFVNPRNFGVYGRQRGWERDNKVPATNEKSGDEFLTPTAEVAEQITFMFEN